VGIVFIVLSAYRNSNGEDYFSAKYTRLKRVSYLLFCTPDLSDTGVEKYGEVFGPDHGVVC
jgi:hypothetical protein